MAMNRLIRDDARHVAIRLTGRGTGYYAAMECEPHDNRPMTAEQAAMLKRLAQAAYELGPGLFCSSAYA